MTSFFGEPIRTRCSSADMAGQSGSSTTSHRGVACKNAGLCAVMPDIPGSAPKDFLRKT